MAKNEPKPETPTALRLEALRTIDHDGVRHEAGDQFDVQAVAAQALIEVGAAVEISQ